MINEFPERGNGYSLYLARPYVSERFVVVMSDHIYEEAFIREALKGKGLVVDREGKLTNTEEATKVKIEDGRVADIGKALEEYDALIGEKEKLEFWSQFIWSKKVKTLGDKS